jgi:ComF family protein
MSSAPPPLGVRGGRWFAARAWRAVDPILAVVFPSACPACGTCLPHPSAGPLCGPCWLTLPRHRGGLCRCGTPLGDGSAGPCGRCRRGLSPFAAGASLGPFEGALRLLVHELKYRGRRRLAVRLAGLLLAESTVRRVLTAGADLVPVPLHPRRRRERGFNQAELLALALARGSGLEVGAGLLVRRRDTSPQAGLSAASRRRNVTGAFAARHRPRLVGRTLVLVDDVITTGATAAACARVLKQAGAAEVRLVTVARVS